MDISKYFRKSLGLYYSIFLNRKVNDKGSAWMIYKQIYAQKAFINDTEKYSEALLRKCIWA